MWLSFIATLSSGFPSSILRSVQTCSLIHSSLLYTASFDCSLTDRKYLTLISIPICQGAWTGLTCIPNTTYWMNYREYVFSFISVFSGGYTLGDKRDTRSCNSPGSNHTLPWWLHHTVLPWQWSVYRQGKRIGSYFPCLDPIPIRWFRGEYNTSWSIRKVCQVLSKWTKNWTDCICIWDTVTKVVLSRSLYQAPVHEIDLTLLAWFLPWKVF